MCAWLELVKARRRVLTEHPDFRRLFGGSTVSLFGSSVTTVALPLTAVSYLDASAVQMGLLSASALLPNLLFALPAGVWLSRLAYRPVLVATDLLQAGLLGMVPVLALLGLLEVWQLYVVVLLAGTCSLFDAVAAESFTPLLVPHDRLLAANGLRALSASTVSTSGNAVAGALVQLLSAPVALAVDALSFVASAFWKSRISVDGRFPSPRVQPRETSVRQVRSGFQVVFGHPVLRSITISATVGALAGQLQNVVLVLYLVRELQLPVATVGLVIAVAGLAGVLGALAGASITARLGHGPTFLLGMVATSLAGFVLATAAGPPPVVLAVLVAGQFLRGIGPSLFGMNQQTIRQSLVPSELLPRALATWRVLVYGVQPVGALLGGLLGEAMGLRAALVVGSVVMLVGAATGAAGPLRRLTRLR